ncbi:YaaA family protein [Glycomyces buryatensis]|uniref:Peroxide stress protein YaaA n=1 Tax=Glycomyces buryatensis TaxID=2570927 RepID=A0A4S8QKR4_9ACTN|nr:peroxide stress protein YaaA [Glycomyces buryatensis]THV41324.1 peroxide stress protein YaaA [Glycomyces buryatensis]
MLILLPPSEGKAVQGDGPPLDLGRLSSPALNPVRELLVDRLVKLCADEDTAAETLKLTARQRDWVELDRQLRTAPTLAAWELYTGVLYDRLGLGDLPDGEQVLIASPLWGLLRPSDRVPPYRIPMSAQLPGVERLPKLWRPAVTEVLSSRDDLVIDLRSGAYTQVWGPKNRGVSVRVFKEDADGKRSVVTHMAKATRGDIARALLSGGIQPQTPADLNDFLASQGWKVELTEPATRSKPWLLDVINS